MSLIPPRFFLSLGVVVASLLSAVSPTYSQSGDEGTRRIQETYEEWKQNSGSESQSELERSLADMSPSEKEQLKRDLAQLQSAKEKFLSTGFSGLFRFEGAFWESYGKLLVVMLIASGCIVVYIVSQKTRRLKRRF